MAGKKDIVEQALKMVMGAGEEIFPHQRAENLSRFVSGSKLLDDAGNPQRLYHITNKDFDVFKPGGEDPTISGPAIWLSPYAEKQPAMHNVGSGSGFKEGTNVMPVYASIKNPLVLDTPEMQDWARTVFANKSSEFPYLISPEAKKAMQDEGYDGIILSGGSGVDNDEVIAFEGNQIKSAIGNTGAYDPTDPRIDRDTGGRIAKGPGGWIDDVVKIAGKVITGEGDNVTRLSDVKSVRARDALIKQLKSSINQVKSGYFQAGRQALIDRKSLDLHKSGMLPLQQGTIVTPPSTWDMPGDWRVSGYWYDEKDPRRFGYRLQNESGQTYDAAASDPRAGLKRDNPYSFGAGFKAYAGPNAAPPKPVASPVEKPAIAPKSPEILDAINKEYESLFGSEDPFKPKAHGGRIAKGPGGWLDDVVSMAGKLVAGEGEQAAKTGIRAYQGSPHDFAAERLVRFPDGRTEYIVGQPDVLPDVPQGAEVLQDFPLGRMRMDKIGTGEGAQAYGHGLYFAENEGVGKGYRDALQFGPVPAKTTYTPDERARGVLSITGGDIPLAISHLEYGLSQAKTEDKIKSIAETIRILKENPPQPSGKMYEVNIAADPNTFLDWDRPLSEQSEVVKKAIEATRGKLPPNAYDDLGGDYSLLYDPQNRPGQFLNTLEAIGGRPDTGEQLLKEAGIPGIKYLDAGSRVYDDTANGMIKNYGSREKALEVAQKRLLSSHYSDRAAWQKTVDALSVPETRNYVVFDDKLISIIRKYGIAGASAMLGYNLMENLDSKQALAATMADREYKESRPKQAEGGSVKDEDSWLDAAMTVARNAADKATFGTSKYAAAGADYLTDAALDALGYENDADFDRALAEQEYAMKEGEEKNPAAAGAGDIIGYVAPYLAVGPAEGALTTLGYLSDYGGKVGKTGSLFARALGFADGGEVPEQGYLESVGTAINQAANPVRRLIGVRTVDLPEGVDEVDYEELMNLAADVLDKSMLGFGGTDPYAKRPKKFPVSPTGKIVDRVLPEEDDIEGALRIAKDVGGGLTPEEVGRRAAQDPATFDAIMQKYAIPDRDIAEYEALKSTVAKQPQDIQQMTHVGAPPMRDVKVDMPLFGGEYNIGSAPYNVAPGMAGVAQTAYDLKTLPMYAFGPTKPLAAGMDVAEGIATGDPTQAALAIAFGPGGKLARAAGIGASSYGMDPAEAQAGRERFFSKLLRTAEELPMEKMTGQQALAMLRKGSSPEELRWTGTEDFLANTPQITKQNLIDYINKNRIQTEDVVLGGSKPVRRDDVVPSETAIASMKNRWDELTAKNREITDQMMLPPSERRASGDQLAEEQIAITNEMDALHAKMIDDTIAEMGGLGRPTKFEKHSTPGGQNYEETLITLPKMPGTKPVEYQVRGAFPQSFKTREEAEDYIGGINNMLKNNPSAELKRDLEKYPPKIYEIYEKPEFWEGHWERPDVIAHVRSQILDATPPGANRPFKAWNGDEFQSKWGQEGRDEGFAKEIDPSVARKLAENRTELMFKHENARENFIKLYEGIQDEKIKEAYKNAPTEWDLPNALKQAQEARRKPHEQKFRDYKGNFLRQQDEFTPEQISMLQDAYDQELSARDAYTAAHEAAREYNLTSGISRAPYVTSTEGWTDLALKKSLDKAIDSGSDYFTWTPGEVQAQRYNLSKVADSIYYSPSFVSQTGREYKSMLIATKNGSQVFEKEGVNPDQLHKYIGKEMSNKLLQKKEITEVGPLSGSVRYRLSGDDLQVGGMGMINYYNKIVPKRLEEVIRKATGKRPKIETITVQTADGPRQQLGIRIDEDLRNARFSDFNKGGRVTGGNTYGNDQSIANALALTREY